MSDMPEKIWAEWTIRQTDQPPTVGIWSSTHLDGETAYTRTDIAKAEIESLREQVVASQWVSVEERLPEYNTLVIGVGSTGMVQIVEWQLVERDEDGEWYAPDIAETVHDTTHWTPIPPRQAKGEQDD